MADWRVDYPRSVAQSRLVNDREAGAGTVTSVATGTGLSGGPITTTGTINLANTAVAAGTYTNCTLTVDAQGRLIGAASGNGYGNPSVPTIVDALMYTLTSTTSVASYGTIPIATAVLNNSAFSSSGAGLFTCVTPGTYGIMCNETADGVFAGIRNVKIIINNGGDIDLTLVLNTADRTSCHAAVWTFGAGHTVKLTNTTGSAVSFYGTNAGGKLTSMTIMRVA